MRVKERPRRARVPRRRVGQRLFSARRRGYTPPTMSTPPTLLPTFLVDLKRTHHCNALRANDLGASVVLMGWVQGRRDHGGRIFIDLRDREGLTQVVFGPDVDAVAHELAGSLRSEFCIGVAGRVVSRVSSGGQENPRQIGRAHV